MAHGLHAPSPPHNGALSGKAADRCRDPVVTLSRQGASSALQRRCPARPLLRVRHSTDFPFREEQLQQKDSRIRCRRASPEGNDDYLVLVRSR